MSTESTPASHEDPDSPAARARRDAEAAWQEAYGRDPATGDPVPETPPALEDPPAGDPAPAVEPPRTELHLRTPEARAPEPARAEPPRADPVDLDAQLAQLQARYDADMRRANDTIAGMRGNLDQLRGQVDLLARQRAPEPPREEPVRAPRLVTPEEERAYGQDLLDVVGRRAQEVYEPVIDGLLRRMQGLEGQIAGMGRHVVQSAQTTLGQVLERDVGPDWVQQNNDPEFLSWLAAEDPISGLVRQQLLIAARDSGNATRIATLFNAYRRETGKYAGQQGAVPGSPTAVTRGSDGGQPAPNGTGGRPGKVPLATLVAPGRSRSPAPASSEPGEVPLMTEREINEHYRLRTLNRVTPADRTAFDARLAAAMAAGKVEVRPKN